MGYRDQNNVSDGHTRMTLKFNYILPLTFTHTHTHTHTHTRAHSHKLIIVSDWFTRGKYGYSHTAAKQHTAQSFWRAKYTVTVKGVRNRSVSLSDMWSMNRTTVENLYASIRYCVVEHKDHKLKQQLVCVGEKQLVKSSFKTFEWYCTLLYPYLFERRLPAFMEDTGTEVYNTVQKFLKKLLIV